VLLKVAVAISVAKEAAAAAEINKKQLPPNGNGNKRSR